MKITRIIRYILLIIFAILMTLFPFIMLPLVGFSKKYQFDNEVKVSPNGPFDAKKA